MENKNTPEYLQKTTCVLLENLRNIAGGAAPSVAMTHCNMPVVSSKEEMEPEDADKRTSPTFNDRRIICDEEMSDSDDDDNRRDEQNYGEVPESVNQNKRDYNGAEVIGREEGVPESAPER
jgi:hypothetical protein